MPSAPFNSGTLLELLVRLTGLPRPPLLVLFRLVESAFLSSEQLLVVRSDEFNRFSGS